MGLFEKKYCSVCGEKIKFLGNRKLEDGNLCKDCANKLSPWFEDRRSSTVEEIKAQLAYREENAKKVEAFTPTHIFGKLTTVQIDHANRQFLIAKTRDIKEENPDILSFDQIIGCDLDIDEDRDEEMRRLDDGSYVSYIPPRFKWYYTFTLTIHVNHPYFDDMKFDLNRGRICVESEGSGFSVFSSSSFNPRNHPAYVEYEDLAKIIIAALTEMHDISKADAEAANAPKTPVICPYCGATTTPDANGCCEYCGAPVAK